MANTPVVVLDDTLTDIANAIRGKNGSSNTYRPGQMADAIDNIPAGTLGIPREVSQTGVYGPPEQNFTFSLPSNATDMSSSAFNSAFSGCTGLTSVDLSSLTTVSGSKAFYYAFYICPSLTSVDLSSLTTVSSGNAFESAFSRCTSLTSVDLSSLTTVSGSRAFNYAFYMCTSLTSVDLSSLTTLTGPYALVYAFQGCTGLISVSFPALTTSSFGTATNQFDSMLVGVTGCTVHFPAAIQSTIGNWTSVQNGFGGTNTTVLFDL